MRIAALLPFLILAFALPHALRAQHEHPPSGHGRGQLRLGTVDFPNSGAAAAQEPFLRGIALLHSYEYRDAQDAFREAQRADPGFALAYWAGALAHSQFDWGVEDLPAARAVLSRLAPTSDERLAQAGDARERAFGRAVETFLDDGTLTARARRFSEAIRVWSDLAPEEVEPAAFAARAALYMLRYTPPAELAQRTEEAIALAERVVAASPDHPGGVHYLIHATDSPRFASRGLAAARAYDRIAPDADHALHMPSHIFLQLGLWDEMVASNERAWLASRAWAARGGHGVQDLGWHSLHWLQYGYLQQGRYAAAASLIDTAQAILHGVALDAITGYPDVRYILGMLAYQYGIETGRWEAYLRLGLDPVAVDERARSAPTPREKGFAVAAAYQAGTAALLGARDTATAAAISRSQHAAASVLPEQDGRRSLLERSSTQLDAFLAREAGNRELAISMLQRAAESSRESGLLPIGPPSMMPPYEALGMLLLEAGRHQEAGAAFEQALAFRPNRSSAWLGKARASAAAGDSAGAAEAYARLLHNWRMGDPDVPARAEAQADGATSSGSVHLKRLSWVEAERVLTPEAVVVIAVGAASKEHGPHLPLSTDFIQAEYVKERVSERTQVIVAPSIGYGYYPPFTEYPGSTTLRLSVFRDMIADICRSLARSSNARRFYVISHGIISVPAMEQVRRQLESEGLLFRFTDWEAAKRPAVAEVRQQEQGSHADEIETSMLLYMAPEMVDMTQAVREFGVQNPTGGRMIGNRPAGNGVFSPSGVYGDPTLATAEKGRRITEAVIASALAGIEAMRRAELPRAEPLERRLAEVTGWYEGADGDTVTVAQEGPLLAVERRGGTRVLLQPVGNYTFGLWTTEARFILGADGRVTHLLLSEPGRDVLARRIE